MINCKITKFSQPILIISGATASGKSQLAFNLAKKFNGVIVNADSMQLYHDLKILSAQPSQSDSEMIEHRLYGCLDYQQNSSVAWWLENVKDHCQKIWQNQQLPIITGGTGFYLQALIEGISKIPEIPNEIRLQAKEILQQIGFEQFKKTYGEEKIIDQQRLLRSCEVMLATNKPISYWQKQAKQKIFEDANFLHLNLTLDRKEIYRNCNHRFLQMLEYGAIKEVENLLQQPIDLSMSITKTIGFLNIKDYLQDQLDYQSMILKTQQQTRNYAKRQLTWFRHQFQNLAIVNNLQQAITIVENNWF